MHNSSFFWKRRTLIIATAWDTAFIFCLFLSRFQLLFIREKQKQSVRETEGLPLCGHLTLTLVFRKSSRKVDMTQTDSLLAFASLHNNNWFQTYTWSHRKFHTNKCTLNNLQFYKCQHTLLFVTLWWNPVISLSEGLLYSPDTGKQEWKACIK